MVELVEKLLPTHKTSRVLLVACGDESDMLGIWIVVCVYRDTIALPLLLSLKLFFVGFINYDNIWCLREGRRGMGKLLGLLSKDW